MRNESHSCLEMGFTELRDSLVMTLQADQPSAIQQAIRDLELAAEQRRKGQERQAAQELV
jgi:hypothetical protein